MSFPETFGSQVAAIMDVLAQAAVAEITQLVQDGAAELRLELSRRESDIQELRGSLKMMEEELRKAREEAATRRAVEERQTAAVGTAADKKGDEETSPAYLEPETRDSHCKPWRGAEENLNVELELKQEPTDELPIQETAASAAAVDVCFESGKQEELMLPSPACSSVNMQQHVQVFSPPAGDYAAHRGTETSYSSAQENADNSLTVQIKVEVESRPACMESSTQDSAHGEQLITGHALGPEQCLQSRPLPAAAAGLEAQRSTADAFRPNTQAQFFSRNYLRGRRAGNNLRINSRVFFCSVCSQSFFSLSQLEEHKALYHPSKRFRCQSCGKSFTQKTRLKTHQSVHTGEKPFSCNICGKMFSRQDNCVRHQRFHSGLKPYSCGQCGKTFTVLGNLRIHQEVHLQGRSRL